MDPKKSQDLDPKLKEIYERVMGTTVAPTNPTPASAIQNQAPTPPPLPSYETPKPPPTSQQTAPITTPQALSKEEPKIDLPASREQTSEQAKPEYQAYTSTPAGVIAKEKGGSKMLNVLLVVAAVLFFSIYALFWLRFFNLSLPFLP